MKRVLGAVAAAAFAVCAVAGPALAIHLEAPIDYSLVPDGWTVICHYEDHVGDFITDGPGYFCENTGGNILVVNDNGLNGHNPGPG